MEVATAAARRGSFRRAGRSGAAAARRGTRASGPACPPRSDSSSASSRRACLALAAFEHVPPQRSELQQVELATSRDAPLAVEPRAAVATYAQHVEPHGAERDREDRRERDREDDRYSLVEHALGNRIQHVGRHEERFSAVAPPPADTSGSNERRGRDLRDRSPRSRFRSCGRIRRSGGCRSRTPAARRRASAASGSSRCTWGRGAYPRVPVSLGHLEERAREHVARGLRTPCRWRGHGGDDPREPRRVRCWRIVPRMLRDVAPRDGRSGAGHAFSSLFALCPIGVLEMAHRDADIAVARAAAAEGILRLLEQASQPMEETARAMGDAPRWFQLYWSTRTTSSPRASVSRAEACGCSAIVLTRHDDARPADPRPRPRVPPVPARKGIAQYTSDPVFLDALQETLRQAPRPAGASRSRRSRPSGSSRGVPRLAAGRLGRPRLRGGAALR